MPGGKKKIITDEHAAEWIGSLPTIPSDPALDASTWNKRILRIIQQDAALSVSDIAAQVGLSQTPCWNRLKRLAASGVIKRRVAILDQQKLGLRTTVLVSVQIGDHSRSELARFAREVAAMDEVIEFYRLAGDVDYCLRVVVADAAYGDFYKRLIRLIPIKTVVSRMALENIKCGTALHDQRIGRLSAGLSSDVQFSPTKRADRSSCAISCPTFRARFLVAEKVRSQMQVPHIADEYLVLRCFSKRCRA